MTPLKPPKGFEEKIVTTENMKAILSARISIEYFKKELDRQDSVAEAMWYTLRNEAFLPLLEESSK